jgi:general secretion pathway protein D
VTKKLVGVAGLLLSLVVLLPGCATYRYTRRASDATVAENWDAAVYYYLEALARDPGNVHFKMALQKARLKAGEGHFRLGMRFRDAGELARAQAELELAVQLDPTHQYAEVQLVKVRKDLAVLNQEGGASKLAEMKKTASEMKVKPPILNPASDEPMSLSFPNQTNLRDIYKAIGQAFGVNILFDPKLKDSKLSIELRNVTARQALEAVVEAAGHFYKVFDEKTVIVVEDTPQNRRDYEDLVVKTFFLSNADVKDVNNMLRALIDARRIAVNEQLNSLVIRDTADKVAIAERLINANDKSKAEVLVDVELLQVDTSKLRDIGTNLSTYTFGASVDPTKLGGTAAASGGSASIPLQNFGNITRSMWSMTLPSLTINLIKSAGEAETLAQPQLRITEREKANLVIGEKVSIPTTTFNTATTVNTGVVPITAYTYQDVGIKLEIEPKVHHNNEVTLKLKIEVSEIVASSTPLASGAGPNIATRNIDTVIRLKDGETSLLAGLTKVSTNLQTSGIPWLSDLPVIGSLFGDKSKTTSQTDLVLTLTPHIIRYPDITEEDLAPLWVGTENRVSIFGNSPRVRSPASTGPMDVSGGVPPVAPSAPASSQPSGSPGGQDSKTAPQTDQPRRFRTRPTGAVVTPGSGGGSNQSSSGVSATVQGSAAEVSASTQSVASDASVSTQSVTADVSASNQSVVSDTSAGDSNGLAVLTFEPARLPLAVGAEGVLEVVIDPGTVGVSGQLHLAYDPARLEVTRVEGGVLQGSGGEFQVKVGHTPVLGWITVDVSDRVAAAGMLLRLSVRPREPGELPVIFAGPLGALIARNGTVVAAPAAREVAR